MISRRGLRVLGAAGITATALPSSIAAQSPKRGATLSLRTWDPPHFDHLLAHAYKTHVVISFTHSRLLRHKAGGNVRPGSFALEGDLAESLTDWALPIDRLGEGAKYYKFDRVEAKRLLAAAGYPNGFPASICFATYGSTQLVDQMELLLRQLKDVGIDARLDQKEYGAYQASCRIGKHDSMAFGPLTPFLKPDNSATCSSVSGAPRTSRRGGR
jgi:hypothetical protein